MSIQERTLAAFAEQYREELPPEFFADLQYCTANLGHGEWPTSLRGRGRRGKSFEVWRSAVLAELHRFLCTDAADYAVLRKKASGLSEGALFAIAGFVAGKCGISIAFASGMVGFLGLAVFRIGLGSFCRLSPEHRLPSKSTSQGREVTTKKVRESATTKRVRAVRSK